MKFLWFIFFLFRKPFLARSGWRCYFGSAVYVSGMSRIFLGDRFRIFPGARIEVFSSGKLIVGDDVAIAQNLHLTCKEEILIGTGSCIAANVCITDIKHNIKRGSNILQCDDTASKTVIGSNCFIGYGAVIDHGTILGDGCVVGANAYVKGVFPPFSIVVGSPAKVVRKYE